MTQQMTLTGTNPPRPPETTDLERRVLAHERILQSLIAYMSRTEPRFVEHLQKCFIEPMAMVHHEQDYRDVDDYAEEFIRAIMGIAEIPITSIPRSGEDAMAGKVLKDKGPSIPPPLPVVRPERVKVIARNGVWEVKVDGAFLGDYHLKEQALAAAALANLSLR
jgi:hypothetical protein